MEVNKRQTIYKPMCEAVSSKLTISHSIKYNVSNTTVSPVRALEQPVCAHGLPRVHSKPANFCQKENIALVWDKTIVSLQVVFRIYKSHKQVVNLVNSLGASLSV